MEKINILVTGAGGPQAHAIMKAGRMSPKVERIIATDISSLAVGLFRADAGYIVPSARDPAFIPVISDLCRKENIQLICSGTEKDLHVLCDNKARIEKDTNAVVLVSTSHVLNTTLDKWETYSWLRSNSFHAPQSALPEAQSLKQLSETAGFPLIVKPRIDAGGSRYLYEVSDDEELRFAIKKTPSPIIQERVGNADSEFTAGVFVERNGICKNAIIMQRWLAGGLTYKGIVDDNPRLTSYIRRVAEKLSPCGPCNIQFRLYNGKPYIFEINPRFSSTTAARWKFGFNEVDMAVRNFVFHEEIPEAKITKGHLFRFWDEIYVDTKSMEHLKMTGKTVSGSEFIQNF